MRATTHEVLICGPVEPPAGLAALIDDLGPSEVGTVAVAGVDAIGPRPTPQVLWRSARAGALVGSGDAWPTAPLLVVPTALLDAVGGVDPRYTTPIAWAELLERLEDLDAGVRVRQLSASVDRPRPDPRAWRRDARHFAMHRRHPLWRVLHRALRDREHLPVEQDPVLDPQIRRTTPR